MTGAEAQREALRRMSPGERWAAAQRLYWSARKLKAAHLRALHPQWSEEEVQRQVKEVFMHVRG